MLPIPLSTSIPGELLPLKTGTKERTRWALPRRQLGTVRKGNASAMVSAAAANLRGKSREVEHLVRKYLRIPRSQRLTLHDTENFEPELALRRQHHATYSSQADLSTRGTASWTIKLGDVKLI